MCGRYGLIKKIEEIQKRYRAQYSEAWETNYNICPTTLAPVIVEGEKGREIRLMKWGLIPSWSEDGKTKFSTINARAETVAKSGLYRGPFKKHRCIVPASGFYEWAKDKKKGDPPMWFTPKGDDFFSFCGIWDSWKSPEGKEIESFSIITTDANTVVGKIHDRMPCAITDNMIAAWISPTTPEGDLQSFLGPYPASKTSALPVSAYVNKVANKGPECIASINST